VQLRLREAVADDAGEVFTVQRAAFLAEGQRYDNASITPLVETLDQVDAAIADEQTVVLVAEQLRPRGPRLVAAGRLQLGDHADTAHVVRVAVAPDLQGRGIGGRLLTALHARVEGQHDEEPGGEEPGGEEPEQPAIRHFELVTGAGTEGNLRFYAAHGYQVVGSTDDGEGVPLAVLRRPILPAPPRRPRARVACYVLDRNRLLVFDHRDFPDAGTQVPAGGIGAGESVAQAAIREVREETGVQARFDALLGYTDGRRPGTGEPHRTACVRLSVPSPTGADTAAQAQTWTHVVGGDGVDRGLVLVCRWASLPVKLAGEQDDQLRLLRASAD
jgi:ADP-ribose pyrophosphatase YjhB (NUDIX family)/GNAT superfamily N-acetyltransferase